MLRYYLHTYHTADDVDELFISNFDCATNSSDGFDGTMGGEAIFSRRISRGYEYDGSRASEFAGGHSLAFHSDSGLRGQSGGICSKETGIKIVLAD